MSEDKNHGLFKTMMISVFISLLIVNLILNYPLFGLFSVLLLPFVIIGIILKYTNWLEVEI